MTPENIDTLIKTIAFLLFLAMLGTFTYLMRNHLP